jgi:hypothetical protein
MADISGVTQFTVCACCFLLLILATVSCSHADTDHSSQHEAELDSKLDLIDEFGWTFVMRLIGRLIAGDSWLSLCVLIGVIKSFKIITVFVK